MQTSSRVIHVSALAMGIAGVLAFSPANASGFQIKENSVKAMGRAFAGSAAAAGDTSVVANNPAAMSTFDKSALQVDVTVIDLSADFTGGGVAAAGSPLQQSLTGSDGGNAGDTTPVPAMSAVFPIGDSGMTVGAMVSAPFGLKTEYDRGWVGRYTALTSDLKTIDLTLAASFDFGSEVSMGVGLVYERAEATLSKAIDFGSAICAANPLACITPTPETALFGPQKNDGQAEVTGSDNGIGWIIGMHIHPNEKTAIGISHRSEISHDLSGTADFTVPPEVVAALGPLAPTDVPAFAPLTTPSVSTISVSYAITDRFTLLGDVSLTGWDSLQSVDIYRRDSNALIASEEFDWEDTVFASLGAEFQLNDSFVLRGGVAMDQTPTNDEARTPRLPDEDRTWFSIGLTWMPSESWDVSAGYSYIKTDDPKINIQPSVGSSGSTLVGSYDASVNLFGVSAQYKF